MASRLARRFFSRVPILGEQATLEDQEAHHAIHVVRLKPADHVTLFDGSGDEFDATVVSIGRASVTLAITSKTRCNREARRHVSLAVPLPKGERQRFLVEKCVEIGVRRLIPLVTARSVVNVTSSAIDRLRRTVIESSKQCGRNVLMTVDEPATMDDLIGRKSADTYWLADSSGSTFVRDVDDPGGPACVVVGPEGGFDDRELCLARDRNWTIVNLGARVLRVETAATCLAAYAIWSYETP